MTDEGAEHTAIIRKQLKVPGDLVEKKAVETARRSQFRKIKRDSYEMAHMRLMKVPRSRAPSVLSSLGTPVASRCAIREGMDGTKDSEAGAMMTTWIVRSFVADSLKYRWDSSPGVRNGSVLRPDTTTATYQRRRIIGFCGRCSIEDWDIGEHLRPDADLLDMRCTGGVWS